MLVLVDLYNFPQASRCSSLSLQAGHAVHEDQYLRTAEVIASFMQRFRIGLPKMQIPTAGHGATRVLPVAAGPLFNDQH